MKKTSEQWQKLCKVTVLDTDGWDRKNYIHSWEEEEITRKEFEYRMLWSTCVGFQPLGSCIWKDFPYVLFWHIRFMIRKNVIAIKEAFEGDYVWTVILPKISKYLWVGVISLTAIWVILSTAGVIG